MNHSASGCCVSSSWPSASSRDGDGADQSVAADSAVAVAEGSDLLRRHRQGTVGVCDQDEVIAGSVAFRKLQAGKGGSVSGSEVVSGRGKGFVHGSRLQFVSRPAARPLVAGRTETVTPASAAGPVPAVL